jgi:amidase
MATSLDSVEIWSKAVVASEPWMGADPDCLPIPWRDVAVPRQLCFGKTSLFDGSGFMLIICKGLLVDDGCVRPLPPVTRALLETKAALEAAGHTVINFHM